MKEITLGELLANHAPKGITLLYGRGGYAATAGSSTVACYNHAEDALQAICVSLCGADTLLDLGRSRQWEQAHGPDGVAGLCDGEAGVVVCRDGALYLVEKLQFPNLAYMLIGKGVAGYPDTLDEAVERVITEAYAKAHPVNPDTLADAATRPCETSLEEEVNPNDE